MSREGGADSFISDKQKRLTFITFPITDAYKKLDAKRFTEDDVSTFRIFTRSPFSWNFQQN